MHMSIVNVINLLERTQGCLITYMTMAQMLKQYVQARGYVIIVKAC